MKRMRLKFSVKFKATEALNERQSLAELAAHFEVYPKVISKWKLEFMDLADRAFEGTSNSGSETEVNIVGLYSQIGQLKVDNDFLIKSYAKTDYDRA